MRRDDSADVPDDDGDVERVEDAGAGATCYYVWFHASSYPLIQFKVPGAQVQYDLVFFIVLRTIASILYFVLSICMSCICFYIIQPTGCNIIINKRRWNGETIVPFFYATRLH